MFCYNEPFKNQFFSTLKMTTTNNTSFIINKMYVKDLSFENPFSPMVFSQQGEGQIKVAMDVKVNNFEQNEHMHEVVLSSRVSALREEKEVFVTEVSYAGIFTLDDKTKEEEKEEILLVNCANFLFPYLARIVATTTTDGGFPPLTLEPVDFKGLYNNKDKEVKKSKAKK